VKEAKTSMNYFEPKSAAERYAKGRPYFHPQVISRIKNYLALTDPFSRAIDVGCGTGLSTVALKEIARRIVGVDNSAQMIALVPQEPRIEYFVSPAEKLPVKDDDFDLMTVSSAFHWIDRGRFFAEARRVLQRQAWLIVYDNCFLEQMQENAEFRSWFKEQFMTKYPSPPRAHVSFGPEDSENEGFHFVNRDEYQNLVKFSFETLVDYLITQSNIIAAVEGGNEKIEDVKQWLTENISPFFGNRQEATFLFGGRIWYLQKAS
jgi:ubiquinone/menaquinone biosynthesis C-methylase UbiE